VSADLTVLGADVGGTTTKIGLARVEGSRPVLRHRSLYPSKDYGSLDDVIAAFLSEPAVVSFSASIAAACFAVAGPVENGRARLTNLPWRPAEDEVARRFRFPRVRLVNDFAAAGLGIEHLSGADLLTLQAGTPVEHGDRVVVGAGTGLGVALLDWDDTHYEVHPSEAGHTDFAPVDALQDGLLAHLRRRFPRVSYERVLSGKGLGYIFDFLVESGAGMPSAELGRAAKDGDAARVISEFGLAGRDALAQQALDIFVSAYGSFAGNMALTMLAQGGVYIAGGIAPKIVGKLQDGTFIRSFTAKGRFYSFLESFPVHVVMNDHVGLYGALAEAARTARRG
jgi:glucokinase